jgi:hypothetical protein
MGGMNPALSIAYKSPQRSRLSAYIHFIMGGMIEKRIAFVQWRGVNLVAHRTMEEQNMSDDPSHLAMAEERISRLQRVIIERDAYISKLEKKSEAQPEPGGLSPIDAEKMRQAACLIEQLESDLEGVRIINKLQAEALADARALNRAFEDAMHWMPNPKPLAQRKYPTHVCVKCGALWIEYLAGELPHAPPPLADGSWSLWSKTCEACCDNPPAEVFLGNLLKIRPRSTSAAEAKP